VVSVLDSGAEGPGFNAVATLSGNSLRQTVHTHCASVHQAAKLVAALLRVARVTAVGVSRQEKVKPIWILLKQETVSGSGISWAICKSASRSRQITMPAPHYSVFYSPDALPAAQPRASKH